LGEIGKCQDISKPIKSSNKKARDLLAQIMLNSIDTKDVCGYVDI